MFIIKRINISQPIVIFFSALALTILPLVVNAELDIEIPSSFNPVGSGARAIGMGGAFIAVSDDATASSWNPGGLRNIRKSEYSIVLSSRFRKEQISFGKYPEADGNHYISDLDINYMGLTFPFQLNRLKMVFSINYQRLYEFSRDWTFTIKQSIESDVYNNKWDYKQSGQLAATGYSYCLVFLPNLSIGFTLNQWGNRISKGKWVQEYFKKTTGIQDNLPLNKDSHRKITYFFKGVNVNLGLLWDINNKWTIGFVFKTPFKAKVKANLEQHSVMQSPMSKISHSNKLTTNYLYMPLSVGAGILYRLRSNCFFTCDLYQTNWNEFKYKNENGIELSPVSEQLLNESNIKPTHQFRFGFEYVFIDQHNKDSVTLRSGFFYDPAPSENGVDDYYGISVGLGLTKMPWFSIDLAYQYRFGNNVGETMLRHLNFSQDVHEHMIYSSIIYYLD